jgi:hypothetical protein
LDSEVDLNPKDPTESVVALQAKQVNEAAKEAKRKVSVRSFANLSRGVRSLHKDSVSFILILNLRHFSGDEQQLSAGNRLIRFYKTKVHFLQNAS